MDSKLSAMKTDISRGTYSNDKGITFGDYATEWVKINKSSAAAGTLNNYQNIITNHINDLKDLPLSKITKAKNKIQKIAAI